MAKKYKQSGLQNLPACVAEFTKLLLKKMRYRRKVREDVQAELEAHFEDALKDCNTDKEKEQKAKQMITEFGDLKLLAILLRRSKKRCRPLWRTVVARTFQAIGVLILCFILYAIWFSAGEPTIRVDYVALFNRMNQPQVLDRDNAWPHYEKAISLYVPQSPVTEKFISYRQRGKKREEAIRLRKLLKDHQQEISKWLGRNQKHWDSLTAEQQAVIQKCFEYDWVPLPKNANQTYTEWQATTFDRMTEHVIKCIETDAEVTVPHPRGSLPRWESPGFPYAELKSWSMENRQIPPNLAEAVSVAVLHEADRRYRELPEDISGPLSDVEQEYISPWIGQNDAAWLEFVAGSSKSYYYRPYSSDPNDKDNSLWSVLMPHLSPLKKLARLGIWRSRNYRKQGRVQESIDDCVAIARVGSHLQGKGTLIEQLVGLGICAIARDETLRLLDTQKLSAADLQNLQNRLSRVYPDGYPLMNMEGERLFFMDVVQRSFTDGGPGGGHLIPGWWDELQVMTASGGDTGDKRFLMPFYTAASMVHAGRDATEAKAKKLYDLQSKLAGMTPNQVHASDLKMPDEILNSMPRHRYFLLQIHMPALARASELAYRGKMGHESSLTVLALKRWQLQKDEYPETLNELIAAGFLSELPMDPYSDKPLVYRKTDEDFILYSVGPNFKDDDGEVTIEHGSPQKWGTSEAGDILLWPVLKQ